MRFFRHHHTEAAFNLACEELLLGEASRDTFFVWQNGPAVIVGRNQNTLTEVNAVLAESHKIDIVRRRSGGGSVYHDLGNLNYTLIETVNAAMPTTLADFAAPLVAALRCIGINAEFTGRNDLTVAGRKFSGCARYTQGNRTVFHATVLVETDLDILGRVLTPRGEKLSRKGVDSVRSRVVNLREVRASITTDEVADAILEAFRHRSENDCEAEALTPCEIAAAEQLAAERYRLWTWNFGHSPQCEVTRSGQFLAGSVTVSFTAERGLLTRIVIRGDFFGRREIADLEQLLLGTPHNRTALTERLATTELDDYITSATPEELITLLV